MPELAASAVGTASRSCSRARSARSTSRFAARIRRPRVVERIEVIVPPSGAAWPATLTDLAKQVDTGRVYDRDLRALAQSLDGME